jgi:hypothetical protein
VIASAGVSVGTLTEFAGDTQVFRDVVDINLTGMVNTFQPFLACMRERGRCGREDRGPHLARQEVRRDPLADGHHRTPAARAAGLALRPALRRCAAQAAARVNLQTSYR